MILDHAPSDSALSNLHRKESTAIQRYALRRIEDALSKSPLDWDGKANIQYLAPLKPADSDYWEKHVAPSETPDGQDDYEDLAVTWGNIALIERSLLSAVEREVWPVKVAGLGDDRHFGLKSSKFVVTKSATSVPTWTRQHIESRSDWLRDSILQLCGKDWATTGKESITSWIPPKV